MRSERSFLDSSVWDPDHGYRDIDIFFVCLLFSKMLMWASV